MPNLAAVLRDEIRRLARKEVKAHTTSTKQSVAQVRRDLAKLKRLVQEQQKRLERLAAQTRERGGHSAVAEAPRSATRYSARSVRAQRKRLGLSAEDYGRLIGVSALTIFNWEHGKARPRKKQLAALIVLRGIGKREAKKRLAGPEAST